MKKIDKYVLIDYDRKFIDVKGLSDSDFLRAIYIALTESIEFNNVDLFLYEDFVKHLQADLRRIKKYKRNDYEFRSNCNKK